ncbi:MAG: hypothetical protein FWE41_03945 [Coriobacteriia bacterium]|nr:hypothetical protein [Coriobacteriia bacterium]
MVKDISRRAFMKIGVALSVAFSGLLAACTGRGGNNFELDELEFLNGLTREELNERLRELAVDSDELPISPGATCYIPTFVEPEYSPLPCSTCSANAQMVDWQMNSLESIQATVNTMIREGFDVRLDVIISCKKCADAESAKYRTIFGIKFKDDASYHLVETSDVRDYEILLSFLQGEKTHTTWNDGIYPLYLRQDVIEKMTGLKHD